MGNPELIGLVLRYRDQQQAKVRSQEIPVMLERLQSTPDYYIEMRWEVSSWGESNIPVYGGGGRGGRGGGRILLHMNLDIWSVLHG